jgi:hypothetical protein
VISLRWSKGQAMALFLSATDGKVGGYTLPDVPSSDVVGEIKDFISKWC